MAQTDDEDEPREVEIGVGGNIKPESYRRTQLEQQFEWHAHVLWESRYVSEGRDNLAGDGLASLSTELIIEDVSIVPWLATAPGTDYSEFNLNIVYAINPVDALEIFLGFNRLWSRESGSNANDTEVSLDAALSFADHYQLLVTAYYSFDAEGAFAELAVSRGMRLAPATLLHLTASAGFNGDYVADGHSGANHGQLRASLVYQVSKMLDINAYLGYTAAIRRDTSRFAGDEALDDIFWGSVGVSYRF